MSRKSKMGLVLERLEQIERAAEEDLDDNAYYVNGVRVKVEDIET